MKPLINFVFGLALCTWTAYSQTLDSFYPAPDGSVELIAIQPDQRILIFGGFFAVNGQDRQAARLNADGTLDPIFNPGRTVNASVVQSDGKILVGGFFTSIGGQACTNLARLNPDGTFDTTFNTMIGNGIIDCLITQPDGKILVGGSFTNLAGHFCKRIGRLDTDGSFDPTFNADASSAVLAMILQPDGRIIVGGSFTNLNGATVARMGRLNADGSLDDTFNSSASNTVRCLAIQTNGLILVGGSFTNLAGATRSRIGRLNTDGSIDSSFNPGASSTVYTIVLQANGKILIGGDFTSVAGTTRNRIARINSNGTLDSFNSGANDTVRSLALQMDGKILVGGSFTNLAGGACTNLGRINNNEVATQNLTFTSSSVTWLRGGSSPEVSRVTFDVSSDVMNWTNLGAGTRIAGGWQLIGISISSNVSVRANGTVVIAGDQGAASWDVQSIAGRPFITGQPVNQKILPGSNVKFSVATGGTLPLKYQWMKDGLVLTNGGKISGATNFTLTVTNLAGTNAGNYAVVITNSDGNVTSTIASLSLVSPIAVDPFNPTWGRPIHTTVAQSDGQIIMGGSAQISIGGTNLFKIARAKTNGSTDLLFRPSNSGDVYSLLAQTDGKVLIGTDTVPNNIRRVNPDGTSDASFTVTANGAVHSILCQPDGKILLAGGFTSLGGQTHNRIGRLNSNGTVDTNFIAGANNTIFTTALQPDGKIVIGGMFTNVNGSSCKYFGRLNEDGSLDSTFAGVSFDVLHCLAIQADGKIITGGESFFRLHRFKPNGFLDTTFNANANTYIRSIALQTDGKIILGGDFNTVNGVNVGCVARLNNDGTLDTTFGGYINDITHSIMIQPDGKIVVGGYAGTIFDSMFGYFRSSVGVFINTESAVESLSHNDSKVTWLRSGTGPEFVWTAFDSSIDGTNWSQIGLGTRISSGWQLAGVSLPGNHYIRARGLVVSGWNNGSSWFALKTSPVDPNYPPKILSNNGSSFGITKTNRFGFDVAALIGQAVVIESSTNLANWVPVLTNTVTSHPFYFLDSKQATNSAKFYRLRLK